MDYEKFKYCEWDISAVVRNLEVIGETAANLPYDFKEEYNEIGWGISNS
ncbi:MAG: hypothetical protein ACLFSM_08340 [Thermoplasmata archaeon]